MDVQQEQLVKVYVRW